MLPLAAIDEAVQCIVDGSITDYKYDVAQGKLVRV